MNHVEIEKEAQKIAKVTRGKAKQGDPDSQHALGAMYFIGFGVAQNFKTTAMWFRKAANQNHAEAQVSLGDI